MYGQIHAWIGNAIAKFFGRGIAYGNDSDAEPGRFARQRVVAIDCELAVFDFGDDE